MRLVAIGDSITWGTYTSDTDKGPNSFAARPFAAIVADALGCDEFINLGINGTSVSRTARILGDKAMSIRIESAPEADILIIAAGTNDYGGCVELGSPEDREDVSFFGGLDVFFSEVSRRYGRAYVVTPIPRMDDEKNTRGYTLDDYRSAIEVVAKRYEIPVIDGRGVPIEPKTEEGRRLHIRDGLHPNPEGHRVYAEYVIGEIANIDAHRSYN